MRQFKTSATITKRTPTLDKYLQEISHQELLSIDEEVELAARIQHGDEAARERLVRANLRFVVSVAKQYQNQGLELEDLIDEGNVGLMKAAEKFDETRGFKFISYAVWWIRQSILQALAEHARMVRLPLNQVGNLNKISKAIVRFEQIHERRPSIEELAEVTDMSIDKVAELMQASGRHMSVDAPFSDGEENSLLDVMINDDSPRADRGLMHESLSTEIDRVLNILSPREAKVLRMAFGIGMSEMSLEEIGQEIGLTRERVRQIREQAITKLAKNDKSKILRSFLG